MHVQDIVGGADIKSKMVGRKKRIVYRNIFLFGFMLLLMGVLVYAITITDPTTLSPANNSAWFGNPTLSCSGASHPNNKPINYTFKKMKETHNETRIRFVSGIGTTNDQSTAPYYMEVTCGSDRKGYVNLTFNSNIWVLDTEFLKKDCFQNLTISIDEPFGKATKRLLYWETQQDFSENLTFNVTDYNDGLQHNVTFWLNTNGAGNGPQIEFYWNKTNSTKYGNTADYIVLQNTSSTTYTWTQNHGLLWSCQTIDKDQNSSIASLNRTIYKMNFEACSVANYLGFVLNFTSWDEENMSYNLTSDWDISFVLNATDSKTYNFEWNDSTSVAFCLKPAGVKVSLNNFLEYLPVNTTHYSFPRQYYFNNALLTSGTLSSIKVYSLEDSLSTSCQFRITEEGSTPYVNATINLQRYEPGSGVYTLVAMGRTDSAGSDVIYLRLTDAWYRYLIYDRENGLRYSSGATHISSCPVDNMIGTSGQRVFDQARGWFDYEGISFHLYFNSTTNNSIVTFTDPTGYASQFCQVTQQYGFNGTGYKLINTTCLTTSSGTITHNINRPGYYQSKFVAYKDNGWRTLGAIDIDLVTEIEEKIGLDGVLMAMMLTGTLSFIGLYSPVAAIMFGIVGFLLSRGFGLINISWGAMIGIIFVGILLIFKQKGR